MGMVKSVAAFGLVVVLTGCASTTHEPLLRVDTAPGANPWTHLDLNNNPDHFQFAIVSDRTGGMRPGVFEDAVQKLNLLQPEFVMSIGDLIEGNTRDQAELDRQWDEFNAFVKGLEMPFFYVPGNHDITNEFMHQDWLKRFGRPYYHFVYRNVLFLCLNTEDPPATQMSEAQAEYVRKALDENQDARWTLVFMHKPMWAQPGAKGWDAIEAMLRGRPHTVFAGHWHDYQKFRRNEQNYIVLATTGGGTLLRGPAFGEFDHVAWLTMTDEGPRLANLMLDGIGDENILTEQAVNLIKPVLAGAAVKAAPIVADGPLFRNGATQLRLTNDADVPMKVRVTLNPTAVLHPSPTTVERVVPPNSVDLVDVKVTAVRAAAVETLTPLRADWLIVYEVPEQNPITVDGSARLVVETKYACLRRKAPVVVDGRLDEWSELPIGVSEPAQISGSEVIWEGSGDGSFRFAAAYDKENVYLAIETVDDRLCLNSARDPWKQDGIEVRLDARPDPDRSNGRGNDKTESFLYLALSPGETPAAMVWGKRDAVPAGVKAACVKSGTGFITEIAIPLPVLDAVQKKPWDAFRLNIAVTDFDGPFTGPYAVLWWRPDWRSPQNFRGSGTFERR